VAGWGDAPVITVKGTLERLMMKTFTLTLLGMLATTTVVATEINESMDAAADGTVSISNVAGSVDVQGWTRNEVEVTGDLGDDVEELIFKRDGDEIEIKVKSQRRNSRDIDSDLVVKVPQGSSLEVHAVSADIDVAGIAGEQSIESVSGDVTTEARASDIDINTVSGDLEIEGDNQSMRSMLSSVSGDIDTENLSGEIGAESVSGDLLVVGGVFDRASLGTVNGDIVFHAGLLDGGRLDVETVNGEVDVEFSGDVSARFDIETFNGDIRNCFGPKAVRVSEYAPGYELKFTEGGGSARVTIETLNGDLRLCR
jgi:DUF4097 and DUF4098 domain-containing protein YvlB